MLYNMYVYVIYTGIQTKVHCNNNFEYIIQYRNCIIINICNITIQACVCMHTHTHTCTHMHTMGFQWCPYQGSVSNVQEHQYLTQARRHPYCQSV